MLNQQKCYYGVKDVPLSETGIAQARKLSGILSGLHFDRIISSPLIRAVNTAEIIAQGHQEEEGSAEDRQGPGSAVTAPRLTERTNMVSSRVSSFSTAPRLTEPAAVEIETDYRLSEQNFGIFEGMTYSDIEDRYPEELKTWNTHFEDYRIPGGESFLDVRARADSFLDGLDGAEGTILIVAHKGTFGHMLASLLNLPAQGYWNFVFDQGCYSLIDVEDGYAIIRKLNA